MKDASTRQYNQGCRVNCLKSLFLHGLMCSILSHVNQHHRSRFMEWSHKHERNIPQQDRVRFTEYKQIGRDNISSSTALLGLFWGFYGVGFVCFFFFDGAGNVSELCKAESTSLRKISLYEVMGTIPARLSRSLMNWAEWAPAGSAEP